MNDIKRPLLLKD